MTRISFFTPNVSTVWSRRVIADRSDAVGLLDGEFGDAEVRGVHAHQGDIGAVQRGDEGQAAGGRHHLLRQHGGDGMGNRVMDVQDVEVVALGDFGHARRPAPGT